MLATLLSLAILPTETPTGPPNVLLIVADDLGFSDLGCLGGEIPTPRLDALAAAGVRLASFYTTARCCPSRACFMTGRYPHAVGLGHMTTGDLHRPGYRGTLSENAVSLAQALAPAGYRSFMAGKWHLGTDDPTTLGFEEFYGTLVSAKTFWDPDHMTRRPAGHATRAYAAGSFHATDAVVDHALDFLQLARQTPDRPWLLVLTPNAPHFPLHATPEEADRFAPTYEAGWDEISAARARRIKEMGLLGGDFEPAPRSRYWNYGQEGTGRNPAWNTLPEDRRTDLTRRMALYAAMVSRLDTQLGRVFDDIDAAGQTDNTLVLFLSDNGACAEWDPFGFDRVSGPGNILHTGDALRTMGAPGTFHSVGSGWAGASNTPFRLYKHFVHEGGVRSPCIVRGPGLPQDGRIIHTPGHLIDILPTLLEAAGLPADPAAPGISLRPLISGEDTPDRPIFFEHEGNRGVRHKGWKLVALRDEPWELYDLTSDPTELHDLASAEPGRVAEMAGVWNAWADKNNVTPLPSDYGVMYLKAK